MNVPSTGIENLSVGCPKLYVDAVRGIAVAHSDVAATGFSLAVAKEGDLTHRYQILNSGGVVPARSLWQVEVTDRIVRDSFRFFAVRVTNAGRILFTTADV